MINIVLPKISSLIISSTINIRFDIQFSAKKFRRRFEFVSNFSAFYFTPKVY